MDEDRSAFQDGRPGSGVSDPALLPVTGVMPEGRAPDTAAWVWKVVVAVTIAVLAGAFALAAYAYVFVIVPMNVRSSAKNVLAPRVAQEYPGYTVSKVQTLPSKGPSGTPDAGVIVSFTLRSIRSPGFVYVVDYSSPATVSSDPKAYENLDDFFRVGGASQGAVDSFVDMWLRSHHGESVYYVFEPGVSSGTTVTYEVDYSRSEDNGTAVTSSQGEYYYSYVPTTGVWTQDAAAPVEAPAPRPADVTPEPMMTRDDGSLVDTGAAVARALPHFTAVGSAPEANGDPRVLVRHRDYPGLRMVIDAIWLDPPDPADGMIAMFSTSAKQARAFAKLWSSLHAGTVIIGIEFDPDLEDANVVEVTYAQTLGRLYDIDATGVARFRYAPKTGVWRSVPVPQE